MAAHSFRYCPQFRWGVWWRVDVAYRELGTDFHAFEAEWGDGIEEQPAASYTWYTFRDLRVRATNDEDVLTVDDCEFEFAEHPFIAAALDPANDTAEIRLWWSDDGASWLPVFWGEIDLEGAQPDTEAIVEGVPIRTFTFSAYDGLRRLNDFVVHDYRMATNIAAYARDVSEATGTYEVWWNQKRMLDWTLYANDANGAPDLRKAQPYDSIVKLTYYLIESARLCFTEHLYHSPVNGKYLFHSTAGTSSLFVLGSWEEAHPTYVNNVEAEFYDWWVPYPLFHAGEFSTEWANHGEFLAELAEMIGCAVTTRHLLEPGGQWVRQLWYVPRDSSSAYTIQPSGLLMRRSGPRISRESRKVVVSTRYPSGSTAVADAVHGARGTEVKLGVHVRTVNAMLPQGTQTMYDPGRWPEASNDNIRNFFWHVLLIPGPGTKMLLANYCRIGITVHPFTQTDPWAPTSRSYNALAYGLAQFYATRVYNARTRLTERYSRANASDGTNNSPAVWVPLQKMGDMDGGTWRVLEAVVGSEENTVEIVKERIDA